MANKLFYLMTYLPALPQLGEPLVDENTIAKIRDEADEKLLLLADLLEIETLIEKTGLEFYVLKNAEFRCELSERLPEDFILDFLSYRELPEAEWLTRVYTAWFNNMIKLSSSIGSQLLADWAKWEFALRTALRIERLRVNAKQNLDLSQVIPEFMNDFSFTVDHGSLVDSWKLITDPMQAEKLLDHARIDFIKSFSTNFSFEIEELVAYMLELRIHTRHARLSLDKGRKILEEVTTL